MTSLSGAGGGRGGGEQASKEQVIYGCLHYITTRTPLSLESSRTESKN